MAEAPDLARDTDRHIANSRAKRPGFFVYLSGLMAFLIFTGFGYTYFFPMATGSFRPVDPVVHIHGLVYFAWMILFFWQTLLIFRGRTANHRSLGMAGISLATLLVVFGSIATLLTSERLLAAGNQNGAFANLYGGGVAVAIFSAFVGLAIWKVRDTALHKRLMTLATLMFVGAGINRVFMLAFGWSISPSWLVNLSVDTFIAAVLLYDWRTLGRPHPVTAWCGMVILLSQILEIPVISSGWFPGFADHLIGLTG